MALKTASVLAFERKLNASDALMYSGSWADIANHKKWQGIPVREKAVRGTISNRLKKATASDPAKVDAEVQKPNLQTVDTASLPAEHDTLKLEFTLRVLGDVSLPSACNDAEYQKVLQEKIEAYLSEHQCEELATRYASNLANGRFLWRNRLGAEKIAIKLTLGDEDEFEFDAYRRPIDQLDSDSESLKKVASYIQSGLIQNDNHRLITVTALAKLGAGQEVFPSQELVQGTDKSKHLYAVGEIAGLHSQKIGNAIRTIDTWHDEVDSVGAIAVEPYGSVTSRGMAYRQPKKKEDFYNLFDSWVLKDKSPSVEQQHFVVAVLIRGGVFGE
jgi:CRISPR-associated protein Csy3